MEKDGMGDGCGGLDGTADSPEHDEFSDLKVDFVELNLQSVALQCAGYGPF